MNYLFVLVIFYIFFCQYLSWSKKFYFLEKKVAKVDCIRNLIPFAADLALFFLSSRIRSGSRVFSSRGIFKNSKILSIFFKMILAVGSGSNFAEKAPPPKSTPE